MKRGDHCSERCEYTVACGMPEYSCVGVCQYALPVLTTVTCGDAQPNRPSAVIVVQPTGCQCMGSGYGGHPDSGMTCYACNGSGDASMPYPSRYDKDGNDT